jgi:hypothetical protein
MYPADTHPCGVLQHLVGDVFNQDILITLVELEGFAAHDIFSFSSTSRDEFNHRTQGL